MPPKPAGIDAIYLAEMDRLARILVEFRAARALWGLLPLLVLVLVDPRPLRSLLVALVGVVLVVIFKREPSRLARNGFSVRFISENARILATVQGILMLTLGGLVSPLLPVLVLFPLAITLVIGPDPSLRPYLLHQAAVVVFLAIAQISGVVHALSPAWMDTDISLAHSLLGGSLLLVMVAGASRLGTYIRGLFDLVMSRVADARADLLAAHQAQAQELTALSGSIAHELKNPLASVKGLAGLLARDLQEGKPRERLTVLREEVDRMQGILEEFLTFSRPLVPMVAEATDLRALVDGVVALHEGLARGRRLVAAGAGSAQVDPRKTKQILINLVQNALDASPPGGQVMVTVRGEGQGIWVWVDDEGPGPDSALGERLFEAGVTTKAAGNGLGLTIARALARQQGGELELSRRPGGGARASLRLPQEQA